MSPSSPNAQMNAAIEAKKVSINMPPQATTTRFHVSGNFRGSRSVAVGQREQEPDQHDPDLGAAPAHCFACHRMSVPWTARITRKSTLSQIRLRGSKPIERVCDVVGMRDGYTDRREPEHKPDRKPTRPQITRR